MPRYTLRKNFKPGDVLYGLHEDRQHYWDLVTRLGGHFITADRYNNVVLEPQLDFDGNYEPNPEVIDNLPRKADELRLSPRDRRLLFGYSDFLLSHPQYAPSREGGKERRGMDGGPKIRRACKAIIEYITAKRGRRLHFLLDHLDVDQVIRKADDSFTGSELRYIYRRWALNPDVRKRVWFYSHGVMVAPPWVTHPGAWNAYQPKSAARI